MSAHGIKLPPLPDYSFDDGAEIDRVMLAYATAAIELDRQGRGEPVAWIKYSDGWCRLSEREVSIRDTFFDLEYAKRHVKHDTEQRGLTVRLVPVFEHPQPTAPVVKESLTVAEPAKEVSDAEIDAAWRKITGRPCLSGSVAHTFARALLASYGQHAQPAASAEPRKTCNDNGIAGNILNAEPCPAPTPQADEQAQQDYKALYHAEQKLRLEAEACADMLRGSQQDDEKADAQHWRDSPVYNRGYAEGWKKGREERHDPAIADKVDACVAPVSDKPACGAQNAEWAQQPDLATAGDWLDELNRLADYYAEKNAEAEYLLDQGAASDDVKGAVEERDAARYAFRTYASQRVQPASGDGIDYSIVAGDTVSKPSWELTPLYVVDVNWALRAAAVRLGEDGGIVVWPVAGLKKLGAAKHQEQKP